MNLGGGGLVNHWWTTLVELRPRVTSFAPSSITIQDRVYGRGSATSVKTDYQISPLIAFARTLLDFVYESSNPAIATVSSTGFVSYVSNGAVIITVTDGVRTLEIPLIMNNDLSGGQVDVFQGFAEGSLARKFSDSLDARLLGKVPSISKPLFVEDVTANEPLSYTWSSARWCLDVDLTAVSVWNSMEFGGHRRSGTLVSPRHWVNAAHFPIGVGARMKWVTAAGEIVERTVIDVASQSNVTAYSDLEDISVGILNADVPAGVSFMKVLSFPWAAWLPTAQMRFPVLTVDQEKKATVIDRYPGVNMYNALSVPSTSERLAFFEQPVVGDSGAPFVCLIDSEPLFLTKWTSIINALMNTLSTRVGAGTNYQLTPVDLSGFPTYA